MTTQRRNKIQGEGDTESADRFNEQQKTFVRSDKGKKIIGNAAELEGRDKRQAEEAEREARDKAAEKDPQVARNYKKAEK